MKKAGKITPVEAMRYEGDWYQRKKIRRGQSNITLLGLTISNLTRNKKRTIITIITLSVTGILFIIISTILSCADPEVMAKEELASDYEISIDSWSEDQMHPEREWTSIQKNNPLDESMEKQIQDITGVNQVIKMQYLSGVLSDYKEDGKPVQIGISGLDETFQKEIEKGEVKGNISYEELLNGDKIIVSKTFLYWYPDIKVGDELHFILYDGDNKVNRTFQIAAIGDYTGSMVSESFLLPSAVIDEICENNMTYQYDISVKANDKEAIKAGLAKIIKTNEFLELKSFDEVLKQWKGVMSIMSEAIYAFLFILSGIGVLNLINTMINSIYIRRREFGMLQAVGMSKNQLNQMLLLEGMFYTLGTLMLSLGLGSLLSYQVFLYAKESGMFSIKTFVYPISQAIVLIGTITIIQIILILVVSHNLRRQSIVERVRLAE